MQQKSIYQLKHWFALYILNTIAEVSPKFGAISDSHKTILGKDSTNQKKYYFLPAVLQTAQLSATTRGENEDQLPEPIKFFVRFKTGYIPLGFVCSLNASLIAESNFELIPFEEDGQQTTYKNKIRFRFLGKFDITMISHPKYCEFHVTGCLDGKVEYWNSECCPRIRSIICKASDRVIQSFQQGSLYKLSKGYELAFKCPHHPTSDIGHEPLAKLVYKPSDVSKSQPKEIVCVASSCKIRSSLTKEIKMWFGEVRSN